MAPIFLRPVSTLPSSAWISTRSLSDFTLEVMEPAPMWDLVRSNPTFLHPLSNRMTFLSSVEFPTTADHRMRIPCADRRCRIPSLSYEPRCFHRVSHILPDQAVSQFDDKITKTCQCLPRVCKLFVDNPKPAYGRNHISVIFHFFRIAFPKIQLILLL